MVNEHQNLTHNRIQMNCYQRFHLGRLEFFKFTGDITTRADTLSAWLGQLFIYVCVLGCEQNMVQRYLSMSSVSEVRKYVPFANVLHSRLLSFI